MEASHIIFYLFAAGTLISAGFIALTNKIVYAAFALMATFLSIAGLYVFAGADFIAITQIMVYVGGILILIVFGVMLTNRISNKPLITTSANYFFGWISGIAVFLLLGYVIRSIDFLGLDWMLNSKNYFQEETITKALGYGLMSNYLLIFEIIAILLLVALIGAVVLAGFKIPSSKQKTDDSN